MVYPESHEQPQQSAPTIRELATLHQLGPSFGLYRYRTAYQFATFLVICATGAALLVPLWPFVGWSFNELSFQDTGGAIFGFVGSAVCGLVALACLWFGIKGLVAAYRNRGATLYLYKEGLILISGGKRVVTRWDQVSAFWQSITRQYVNGIRTTTTYFYRIRTLDNREYVFGNNISDIAEVGQILSREITRTLLPKARTAYEAGETVSFGKFRVNKQGICQGEKTLPWNGVEGIKVETGKILFKKRGQWLNWSSAQVAEIPNALVLIALVNFILEQRNRFSQRSSLG